MIPSSKIRHSEDPWVRAPLPLKTAPGAMTTNSTRGGVVKMINIKYLQSTTTEQDSLSNLSLLEEVLTLIRRLYQSKTSHL
jgi:hypothetical protein